MVRFSNFVIILSCASFTSYYYLSLFSYYRPTVVATMHRVYVSFRLLHSPYDDEDNDNDGNDKIKMMVVYCDYDKSTMTIIYF